MAFDKITQEKFDRMNLDENNVKNYSLPQMPELSNACEWHNKYRKSYLNKFKDYMYGKMAPRPDIMEFETIGIKTNALDGIATRKLIKLNFKMSNGKDYSVDMLLYIPNNKITPAPVFIGLNFASNAACTFEKDIPISRVPSLKTETVYYDVFTAGEEDRGCKAERWPLKKIIERGYAVATCYCNELFLDLPDGYLQSIYKLFYSDDQLKGCKHKFGAIGAWAWGLSRMVDYLESDKDIDSSKIAAVGHSRLGKTALWAGANDQRIGIVISNGSGCCGAKLSKRNFGENFEWIIHWREYWFTENFHQYVNKEDEFPLDQHQLISICAPRPVYVASGSEDFYADPKGEFIALREASAIYQLYGSNGLAAPEMPPLDVSIQNDLGYHVHTGPHNITIDDWKHFLDFADKHFVSI